MGQLGDMPDELLLQIVKNADDDPKALLALSNTNRQFANLLDNEFWRSYFVRRFEGVIFGDNDQHYRPQLFGLNSSDELFGTDFKQKVIDAVRAMCTNCSLFSQMLYAKPKAELRLCGGCIKERYEEHKELYCQEIAMKVFKVNIKDLALVPHAAVENPQYLGGSQMQLFPIHEVYRISQLKKARRACEAQKRALVKKAQSKKKQNTERLRRERLEREMTKHGFRLDDFKDQATINSHIRSRTPALKRVKEILLAEKRSQT